MNDNTEAQRFWASLGLQPTITVANAEPTRILEAITKKPNKKKPQRPLRIPSKVKA